MTNSDRPLAKFVRLQNGDDIVTEIVEMEDENGILYTVFNPLKVVYMPSESVGYLSVAFMPWVFPRICDQQEFVIHAEDVMLIADVTEKMNIYYWDSVDSMVKPESTEPEKSRMDKIKEAAEMEYDEDLYSFEKKVFH
jgi:hypothetical protein